MIRPLFLAGLVGLTAAAPAAAQSQTWPTFNGDLKAQKYSTETAITPANVNSSSVAMIYTLLSRTDYDAAVKGGTPHGYHAMAGVPYGVL